MSTSSSKYATPLSVELAPPGYLIAVALGVHILAAIALLISALHGALICAVLAILSASACLSVFRLRYFTAMVWRGDGSWLLWARNGRHVVASLESESLATPYVALLNFTAASDAKRFSIVVHSTPVNADALRRLRVRLRLDAATLK